MAVVLVPSNGVPELLPPETRPIDLFHQVSLMSHPISQFATVYWALCSANGQQLNEYGTRTVGCNVHGDVCISLKEAVEETKLGSLLLRLQSFSSLKSTVFNKPSGSDPHFQPPKLSAKKNMAKCVRNNDLSLHSFDFSKGSSIADFDISGPVIDSHIKDKSVQLTTNLASWSTLPGNILSWVASHLLSSARDLVAISGVCPHWRSSLLEDHTLLRQLHFTLNVQQPFIQSTRKLVTRHCEECPALLDKALILDNISALRCHGLMLDEVRLGSRSCLVWQRLLRLGDVYGCWKMGEILYEGRSYMPMNQPDAFHAFSRAAKKAMLMDDGPEKSLILSKVCIYLGYCFLDGDAEQKQDNETAIYWFRLASQHGNEDAKRVCGWIFNSGMYG